LVSCAVLSRAAKPQFRDNVCGVCYNLGMTARDNIRLAAAPILQERDTIDDGRVPRLTEPLLREKRAVPGLKPALEFTEAGKRFLKHMAYYGNTPTATARAMGVSHAWLLRQIKENEEIKGLWEQYDAMAGAELKAAGFEMAMVNPAQNQYERKVRLGETDKKEVDVQHTHYVVGMLPDKKQLTHDEWDKMFSPHKDEGAPDDA
jgi:hypothetical protein